MRATWVHAKRVTANRQQSMGAVSQGIRNARGTGNAFARTMSGKHQNTVNGVVQEIPAPM